MEFLAQLLTPEGAGNFLSQAAQSDLAEKLLIIAIVWRVMGKKVADHFKKLEQALDRVAAELKQLKETVPKELGTQSIRVATLETHVVDLGARVKSLETIHRGKLNGKSI